MASNMSLSALFKFCTIAVFFDQNFAFAENAEMYHLKEKVMHLENVLNKYDSRINFLEKIVVGQDKKIQLLQTEVTKLKHEVSVGIRMGNQRFHVLKNILMNQRINQPKSEHELSVKSTSGKSHVKPGEVDLEEHRHPRARALSTPVAFYAFLSNDIVNPGQKHTIIFDVVKTNTANAYNRFSGLFTVPVNGTYVITSSVYMHGNNEYSSYEIVKNGDVQGTFFVDAENESAFMSGSMTVVIEAEQGQVIYLRTGGSFRTRGSIFSRNYARSSFAGWRIY